MDAEKAICSDGTRPKSFRFAEKANHNHHLLVLWFNYTLNKRRTVERLLAHSPFGPKRTSDINEALPRYELNAVDWTIALKGAFLSNEKKRVDRSGTSMHGMLEDLYQRMFINFTVELHFKQKISIKHSVNRGARCRSAPVNGVSSCDYRLSVSLEELAVHFKGDRRTAIRSPQPRTDHNR